MIKYHSPKQRAVIYRRSAELSFLLSNRYVNILEYFAIIKKEGLLDVILSRDKKFVPELVLLTVDQWILLDHKYRVIAYLFFEQIALNPIDHAQPRNLQK